MENEEKKELITQESASSNALIAGKLKCPIMYFKKEGDEENKHIEISPVDGLLSPLEMYKHHARKLTATQDNAYADEIIKRAAFAMPNNRGVEENLTLTFQILADEEPKDPTEAKLCLQANVLYANGMQYLYRAEKEERIMQSEHLVKNAIKLLRLHNETIEALNRYRRKGEQRVVVQHVNVENGGKAIVGNIMPGGNS